MVQDGLAGAISTPALISRNGGTRGGKDDAAICCSESRERSLDLYVLATGSTQARCRMPALVAQCGIDAQSDQGPRKVSRPQRIRQRKRATSKTWCRWYTPGRYIQSERWAYQSNSAKHIDIKRTFPLLCSTVCNLNTCHYTLHSHLAG